MDLELTDEQRWVQESIDTLLDREWTAPESVAEATLEQRHRVWDELVAFGALSLGGEDGIGAVEACLIARSLGSHLASTPFAGSAAFRLAVGADATESVGPGAAVALALLEPGSSWSLEEPVSSLRRTHGAFALAGEKVAVEQVDLADWLAVSAAIDSEPALALVPSGDPGVVTEPRTSIDSTLPMSAVAFADASVAAGAVILGPAARGGLSRLAAAGSLLAAADAIGAADRILDEARRYAGERRQFGRPIGSFQSLRHIMADMYVRCASGWSAVLYGAAAFDDAADDAGETAWIAKAYVSRGAREVAHGAMQVFGGIAFTDEHPAHRYLRRILVREQQFGDAVHHERALGRALAGRAGRPLAVAATVSPA
jgi:alkylation response protein AidB-like acyl-CoA dehydrogenase